MVNVKTKMTQCISCEIDPRCLFNNANFGPSSQYFVFDCNGPDVPRSELRSANQNELGIN